MLGFFAVILGLIPKVADFANGIIPNIGVELLSEAIEDFTEGGAKTRKLENEASSGFHATFTRIAERLANSSDEEKRIYNDIFDTLNAKVKANRGWIQKLKDKLQRKTAEDVFASDILREFLGELESFEAEKYIETNFPELKEKYGQKVNDEYLTPIYGTFIELVDAYAENLYRICFNNLPREQRTVIKVIQHQYERTFKDIKTGVDEAVKNGVSEAFAVLLQQHEPMTQIASNEVIKSPFAFVKRVCPHCGYDGEHLYYDKDRQEVYCSACGEHYDIIENKSLLSKEIKDEIDGCRDALLKEIGTRADATDKAIVDQAERIIKNQVSYELFSDTAKSHKEALENVRATVKEMKGKIVEEIGENLKNVGVSTQAVAEELSAIGRRQLADNNAMLRLMRSTENTVVDIKTQLDRIEESIVRNAERRGALRDFVCNVCGARRKTDNRVCPVCGCDNDEKTPEYLQRHTATLDMLGNLDYGDNENAIVADKFMRITASDPDENGLTIFSALPDSDVHTLVIENPSLIVGEPFIRLKSLTKVIVREGLFKTAEQDDLEAGAFRGIELKGTVFRESKGFVSKTNKDLTLVALTEDKEDNRK